MNSTPNNQQDQLKSMGDMPIDCFTTLSVQEQSNLT